MKLLIKTENEYLKSLYNNHEHFHPGDSGLDSPGCMVKIDLQVQCEGLHDDIVSTNVSYYLYPRSSIIKTPLRMANSVGIIDAGYRGNIIACVDNVKNYEYKIEKGSRLFQICGPTLEPIVIRVVNELSNSQRGSGGFGSTG